MENHPDDLDRIEHAGLAEHLPRLERRTALTLLGGLGLGLGLAACGVTTSESSAPSSSSTTSGGSGSSTTSESTSTTASAGEASCTQIPEETAGPYPGDGSNGPDVLSESGVVRSDITSSFGSASGTAEGVPLAIEMTVVDLGDGCRPLEGAAVYVWHCDRDGGYSMYSQGITGENYLRGVQETDADGLVRFTSTFPGAYAGRWPHIHFEVYPSTDAATTASSKLATSQIALPEDACDEVYGEPGYEQSVTNVQRTSLDTDNVFRDGWSTQLGTVTGTVDDGLTVALTVPVSSSATSSSGRSPT